MRILFMGTPDFASACLERLINDGNDICGVFTQPDKKTGRKQILTAPPVKELALKHNIEVFQPEKFNNQENRDIISRLNPELIVVVAYGKILPADILYSAKHGSINVHASLLPKYRGCAPIQWAILNGEKETGVCIMQMDEGIDTGDVLYTEKTEIGINETSEELFERLSALGADALSKAIELIKENQIKPVKQVGESSYAPMIDKSISRIDWNKSAFEIHNKIRGLQVWPAASAVIADKEVKIHKSVLSQEKGAKAGEVVCSKGRLTVSCGDGNCIDILEIQPNGKKRMDIKSFLAGNKICQGDILE